MYTSAFEDWYKSTDHEACFDKKQDRYADSEVQGAWVAWQAAINHHNMITKTALTKTLRDKLNAFMCEQAELTEGEMRKALQFLPLK